VFPVDYRYARISDDNDRAGKGCTRVKMEKWPKYAWIGIYYVKYDRKGVKGKNERKKNEEEDDLAG